MGEASSSSETVSFDSLPIDLRLLKAVRKLGLEKPTPIQAHCIPLALEGKDVLARAPTGSGKTYAYSIPLLQKVLARYDSPEAHAPGVGAVVLVPTRELCQQVNGVLQGLLGHAGAGDVRVSQLASPADSAALRAGSTPDVLVATPSQLLAKLDDGKHALRLKESLHTLVIDEADLLLSYGYGEDITSIGQALPGSVHTLLLSATITPELKSVTSLFLHNPVTIDLEEAQSSAEGKLSQFWLRCSHSDKFLVMYALFKLNRIPGRSLIFVNSVDRGFRLKLFLEQFGVSSGVLNCELPLESRWHCIQAFNRGVFDILVATDDPRLMKGSAGAVEEPPPKRKKKGEKKGAAEVSASDAEFGVSRGVDFCDVTAVVNMDLPSALSIYKHRIGRTARGGKGGTAISMVDENEGPDARLLEEMQREFGEELHQFHVDMSKLAAFRYRVEDGLRAVTRQAVKEARLKEIKQELVHSKKLAEHFDANPDDLDALRHDKPLATARRQPHLAHVPRYLKPETEGATASVAAVAIRKRSKGPKRRATFGSKGAAQRKGNDPLRSFKAKKGAKKR